MGERSVRIRKVEGSTPFESIKRRIVLNDTAFLFVLGSCFFQYSCPSGCDTSKLLSDDLKNKLYYDCFQKMLYHYSHHKKLFHRLVKELFVFHGVTGFEQPALATAGHKQSSGLFARVRENPRPFAA